MSTTTLNQKPKIHAVDLFCGAGGLTCGLKQAGIGVMAGVDVETRCEFAYSHRNSRRKPPNSFGWRNAALIHTRKRPCARDAHFATLC